MSICVLCSLYPNEINPSSQVFVQQLVWALADLGVDCTVICPIAINLNPSLRKLPYFTTETSTKGAVVKLYFPKFISLGQRNILGLKTARITTDFYFRAVLRAWKKILPQPDVVYGHFFTPAGICASRLGKGFNVSAFAAYGENSPWSIKNFGQEDLKKEIANLSGVVAVSSASHKTLEKLQVIQTEKVRVFPNGACSTTFFPRDKHEARARFGFDQGTFLVAFLGEFSERKGVMRLAKAAENLENVSVGFAGKGSLQPNMPNCVFSGVVKHKDLPYFLSAADVFVLPTLREGCSNAIVEALACGLPIISSALPFNDDILNSEYAILIDPTNIQEIRDAIIYLRDNPKVCESMGRASLKMAKTLTIESRARKIYSWISEKKNIPSYSA